MIARQTAQKARDGITTWLPGAPTILTPAPFPQYSSHGGSMIGSPVRSDAHRRR